MRSAFPAKTRVLKRCAALVARLPEDEARKVLMGGWPAQRDWMKEHLGMWGQSLGGYLKRRLGVRLGILSPRAGRAVR